MTRDDALNALRDHHNHAEQVRARLEAETAELVAAARNAHPPATWPQIADALGGADAGKHAQNVRRKYLPLLDVTVRVKPTAADRQPQPETGAKPVADTVTFTPGCTLDIKPGVHGKRPIRIRVLTRSTNHNGTTQAVGHVVRADGSTGRQTGVTIAADWQYTVAENPYNETAAGRTPAGRDYSLARNGNTVLMWGNSPNPREIHCDSEQVAADKFRDLAAQLAGQQS